jgi:hypothetical protein
VELTTTGTREEEKKKGGYKRFALATQIAGMGTGLGIMGVNNAFMTHNSRLHTNINTPEGDALRQKIVDVHKAATSLSDPFVVSPKDIPGLPKNFEAGAYIPHLASKYIATGIPNNQGMLVTGPQTTDFILAHELGHRAQDYQKFAGPSQLASGVLSGAAPYAAAALSAKAETNRGAFAKGMLASYALHLPKIVSEINATRIGGQYLKTAGIESPASTSLMQPLSYLLAPAAQGLMSVAQGRVIRAVKNKLKNRKKQKEQPESLVNESPSSSVLP